MPKLTLTWSDLADAQADSKMRESLLYAWEQTKYYPEVVVWFCNSLMFYELRQLIVDGIIPHDAVEIRFPGRSQVLTIDKYCRVEGGSAPELDRETIICEGVLNYDLGQWRKERYDPH